MNRRWNEGGVEPALDDLIADPIADLLRVRDGISEEDVRAVIHAARQRRLPEWHTAQAA